METRIKRGQILKELREKKGLKQEDVALFLGITQQAYGRYEKGTSEPNADGFNTLADFYGVTTDYLLGREPLPDPFADLDLRDEDEKEVLAKYMSLPPQMRAVLLDALRQLGGVMIDSNGVEQPTLMRTTTTGEIEDSLKSEHEAEKDGEKFA